MYAANTHLFLNFQYFDRFIGYLFCGLQKYISVVNQIPQCINISNPYFYNIGYGSQSVKQINKA